jgi:hypothetical protein
LAIYVVLLELYSPEFLTRRRAEMLQNFGDLENGSSSNAVLWLLIGRDLMFSLISRNIPESLWGQIVLMVIVLAIALAGLRAFTSRPM